MTADQPKREAPELAHPLTAPTTVVFADPEHGPRSQMAEALFRSAADARGYDVSSAGTAPGADLSGVAEVLAERGVSFTPAARALDVTMAPDLLIVVCEEGCAACPYLPLAKRVIRWPIDDPASAGGARVDALREVASELEARAAELVAAAERG